MKKAVILFIIFLIILGAGIAEHFFVHKTFDAFNERIGKIEAALQNDDVDSALSYAEATSRANPVIHISTTMTIWKLDFSCLNAASNSLERLSFFTPPR